MGCINSKCIAQLRQQDTDDFYSVGDINQPRWLGGLKKYDKNEELMYKHALHCAQKDTGDPSELPNASYEIGRRLARGEFKHALHCAQKDTGDPSKLPNASYEIGRRLALGEFKFTNTSEKPSTSGLSMQQAPNIRPTHQLLTLRQEGPPSSAGAVRKRRNGLPSRNDQCHKTSKIPTKQKQVPTPAQKEHKDGQEACINKAAEELPTPVLLITQPEDTNPLHENEAQQKKENDSKETADAAEDFKFKELLNELQGLKHTHLKLLYDCEADAERQMKAQQKIQNEICELQKAVCTLRATYFTQCASIAEQITFQGSAITQAIKSLTAVLEKMPFINPARVREETPSGSKTTSHEDEFYSH